MNNSDTNAQAKKVFKLSLKTRAWVALVAILGVLTPLVASDRTYPPYPEVWHWLAPSKLENIGFRFQKLNDGDVQIVYEDRRKTRDDHRPVISTKFFNPQEVKRAVLPTESSLIAGTQSHRATLKSGFTVHASMGPGLRSNRCYDRLNGAIWLTNSEGKEVSRKTIFFVFDKPRTWKVSKACRGMDGPDVFAYQAESLFAELLALDDDTFLIIDSLHGVVIRFNTNFQTKSNLLNRVLFVMDTRAFEKLWIDNFRDDELDKIHNALYKQLMVLKEEK